LPAVERHAPWLFRLSRRHVKRFYLARNVHAVRLSRGGRPAAVPDGPLIVVLNHPSWWDPLVGLALTELFPDRNHFAPMEGAALGRYRFFERLGMFGVESGTVRGARTFLRTGCAILARPGTVLWVTAQGRFADPRQRPPGVRPGVARLVRELGRSVVLPLALEYPFWDERYPEALARFSPALVAERGGDHTTEEWRARIEQALGDAQDSLAAEARRRDPTAFETLVGGKAGVGGVYGCWRWLRALARGERVQSEPAAPTGLPAPGGPSC
jgi:1-acyl-sn-glycerol-3-phosphate acyltransferase